MTNFDEYFKHLTTRSRLGLLYRRLWLYPTLCRELEGRVLDVGCGIGDLLTFRPNTLGADINPRLVAFCQARGLEAYDMPIDVLPFGDGSFQGVVLDNVLEHIRDPEPLLSEARRVLRSKGTLLIGVPGEKGYQADPDHKVYYDEPRLAITMSRAGFSAKRVMHMPVKSALLNRWITQYALYATFERIPANRERATN